MQRWFVLTAYEHTIAMSHHRLLGSPLSQKGVVKKIKFKTHEKRYGFVYMTYRNSLTPSMPTPVGAPFPPNLGKPKFKCKTAANCSMHSPGGFVPTTYINDLTAWRPTTSPSPNFKGIPNPYLGEVIILTENAAKQHLEILRYVGYTCVTQVDVCVAIKEATTCASTVRGCTAAAAPANIALRCQ